MYKPSDTNVEMCFRCEKYCLADDIIEGLCPACDKELREVENINGPVPKW